MEYVNLVENVTGKMLKNLRYGSGKKYPNKRIYEFAIQKGIGIKPSMN